MQHATACPCACRGVHLCLRSGLSCLTPLIQGSGAFLLSTAFFALSPPVQLKLLFCKPCARLSFNSHQLCAETKGCNHHRGAQVGISGKFLS